TGPSEGWALPSAHGDGEGATPRQGRRHATATDVAVCGSGATSYPPRAWSPSRAFWTVPRPAHGVTVAARSGPRSLPGRSAPPAQPPRRACASGGAPPPPPPRDGGHGATTPAEPTAHVRSPVSPLPVPRRGGVRHRTGRGRPSRPVPAVRHRRLTFPPTAAPA